jgi:hypothetical protein
MPKGPRGRAQTSRCDRQRGTRELQAAEMERARRANSETGPGFACGAKLSGGQKPVPAARVARFVKMTQGFGGLRTIRRDKS